MTTGPTLAVAGSDETLALQGTQLVVAGYTARDRAAVQAHIDELAAIGVEPPPNVPIYYPLDPALLTTAATVRVRGERTSGEVEPVIVWCGGHRYLGLGSDHTDREVETTSVAESKAAAPKPLGTTVVPLDVAIAAWDDIRVTCRVDGRPYQDGLLVSMLQPERLIDDLSDHGNAPIGDGVMFCGTLPLLTGEFVYGTDWELELHLPGGRTLTHAYRCIVAPQ